MDIFVRNTPIRVNSFNLSLWQVLTIVAACVVLWFGVIAIGNIIADVIVGK
jgi:hypothetical protein